MTILTLRSWADSTGRRNTFDHILFEQLVECLCRCLPGERLSWSCVQCMGNSAQLVGTVAAKVRSRGKVLAKQTIGVFVAAALPGALRVAEVDVEAGIDPELDMLRHLRTLVRGQRSACHCAFDRTVFEISAPGCRVAPDLSGNRAGRTPQSASDGTDACRIGAFRNRAE